MCTAYHFGDKRHDIALRIRIIFIQWVTNINQISLLPLEPFALPRSSSGRKCDCCTIRLGFDSRVGQSIVSVVRKFLSCSTESGNVLSIWLLLTPYYMGLITQVEKSGCTFYSDIACRNVHLLTLQ
ncbi:hypothetical protein SFRURICE_003905, partial [Spodoptera frugiperda]